MRCSCVATSGAKQRERRGELDPWFTSNRERPAQAASYETREGEKRTVVELEVDEIGPSLKYATAKVNKANRGGGGGGGNFGGSSGGSGGGRPSAAPSGGDDPWGQCASGFGSFGGAGSDEPPF